MATVIHPLASHPDVERGFGIIGVATDEPPHRFCKPGFFKDLHHSAMDGDLLIVKYKPNGAPHEQNLSGLTAYFIIHIDEQNNVSLSRLFIQPHDRAKLRRKLELLRLMLSDVDTDHELETGPMHIPESIPSFAEYEGKLAS